MYNILIFDYQPQIKWDYPLNLSILISGGRETNKDFHSNGEWSGNSPNLKSIAILNCSFRKYDQLLYIDENLLEKGIIEGENPVNRLYIMITCLYFSESGCLGMQS